MTGLERIGKRAAKRAIGVASELVRPSYKQPGHYYSPVPNRADVERAITGSSDQRDVKGIDVNPEGHRKLAAELSYLHQEVGRSRATDWRYRSDNEMFNLADASMSYAMLDYFKPTKLVEVGSGFSSAVALDAADKRGLNFSSTFVEPNSARLRSLLRDSDLHKVTIIEQFVQDCPLSIFEELGPNDVAFIDSTHVVKAGSDVNHIVFEILPRLRPGVVVHVHDMFWPFEYPASWLREGRVWTENYLIRAWLMHNPKVKILFFSSWFWAHEPALVKDLFPNSAHCSPGSLWLQIV